MWQKFALQLLFVSIILFPNLSHAQLGGSQTYSFLRLPFSARAAALGGSQLAVIDRDPTLAFQNPALLNEEMANTAALSFIEMPQDLVAGSASYTWKAKGFGFLQSSLQFINYGNFTRTDQYGNVLGQFTAGEYNLNFSGSKKLGLFTIGAGFNLIYSQLHNYTAFAFTGDAGAIYESKNKLFTAAFSMKHLGTQIQAYSAGYREPTPLNIQMGFTKKFEHMPVRFGLVVHHLNVPDLTFINTSLPAQRDLETGEIIREEPPFTEIIFRHFIFNAELLLSENFHIRLGYNHQRRKENAFVNRQGLVGFTFGGGIKISRFQLDYALNSYHLAGINHQIGLSSNFSDWVKDKE